MSLTVILSFVLTALVDPAHEPWPPVRAADAQSIRTSAGDPRLDAWLECERQRLAWLFGVRPNLVLFDDGDNPNAYASGLTTGPQGTGTIALGSNLLHHAMATPESGELALAVILAHEWSHILQLRESCTLPGKQRELHADFLAGYYLGWRQGPGSLAVAAVAQALHERGDYSVTSANHHGTPDERVRALMAGFSCAGLPLYLAYHIGQQRVVAADGFWQPPFMRSAPLPVRPPR